jgi:hypothetical protein
MLIGEDDLVNISTGMKGCATFAGSTDGAVT